MKKKVQSVPPAMVLFCLIRWQKPDDGVTRFLLINKGGYFAFPPTKFREEETLYDALVRPMEEDLHLPHGSYYPEMELPVLSQSGPTLRHIEELREYVICPILVSVTSQALLPLTKPRRNMRWWTLDEILQKAEDPNVLAIAQYIKDEPKSLPEEVSPEPSMDAVATEWAVSHEGGIRVVRNDDIRRILDAGSRAFNLRVADPYLPYQRQGLGFTWSFFTPKDGQDCHVHGLPAVEIYGVFEGRLQLWYKPMNRRGPRTWKTAILEAGDWAEVEPLNCHVACWLDKEGLGMVVKAASTGELAGVGKLGVSGKTTCANGCTMKPPCALPPNLKGIIEEYTKPFAKRDFNRIRKLAKEVIYR